MANSGGNRYNHENPAVTTEFRSVIISIHDHAHVGDGTRTHGPEAQPGGRAARPAPVRQDHAGAPVRRRGLAQLLRPRRPARLARLSEPDTALRPLKGLVVIDEIQRRPDLFPLLRVLADRKPLPARFLILGSASPGLAEAILRNARRAAGNRSARRLPSGRPGRDGAEPKHWLRGGFPLSFTARTEADSLGLAAAVSADLPRARHAATWASPFPPSRCGASGTWSPITTGRFGTPPNWPAPLPSTNPPCAATST